MNIPESGIAFDRIADTYDADSTNALVSRWLRRQLWAWLATLFPSGSYLLELGCGTGEDAVWFAQRGVRVLATDISPRMLALTEQKAAEHGVAARVQTQLLDFDRPESWQLPENAFDGVYSNYGALNCTANWSALGTALARVVRPSGCAAFGIINRFSLLETLWHAAHLDLRTASRRWRGKAIAQIGGVDFLIYYPTPRHFCAAFGAAWQPRMLRGWGIFLPPSDLYGALARRPRLFRLLCGLERCAAHFSPSAYLADQFWIVLQRR
ncbi:MAG: class I SAM-dependent methyltransferase [Anaerolineae bacterium]|nr:class I SAM-dependent methyltransferase [Anaerolineae bacterium]MDW8299912.1 class I SAM-dependent methyltransferase [Anaerolineae bacterium]